jgi:hypothetical protein
MSEELGMIIWYHNIQTTYDIKKGGRQNDLG